MKKAGGLAVVVMAVLSLAGLTRSARLEIVGRDHVVWSAPIRDGERFDVSFIHSQEQTRFVQHYVAKSDGSVAQDGVSFGSYGAGMPLGRVVRTGELFTAHVQRRLVAVPMLSSHAARLRLRYRDRDVAIDQWFDDFDPFEIRIR